MTSSPRKTVALADTRWFGHHPTYLLEFTASLLRCRSRVILMCAEPQEIRDKLAAVGIKNLDEDLICIPFTARNQSYFQSDRDHDPLTTIMRWYHTGKTLRVAERNHQIKADFVFLAYLDSYIRFAPLSVLPTWLIGRPWSGLYFRNHHFAESSGTLKLAAKGDFLLRNSLCQAVCVLDERFDDAITSISGQQVIHFPDVTDETPPADPSEDPHGIRQKARGRKIIGLISMEKRKGLITLLKAAVEAHQAQEPWYFVATGPFLKSTFSDEELEFCESILAKIDSGEMDNIHFDTSGARIPDGQIYNSLFTKFDLIWAAYEGFEGSSNALTKAAIFKIPLVATSGQCIGNRVKKYQLGTTFEEADVPACMVAIRSALAGNDTDGSLLTPQFEAYQAEHSRSRLDEIFGSFMV
ncbi:hypothetical protein JIN85_08120 [Luteolibacter pohnpeiensis]|uniref:Uncharacterized protein n=1 Tax=Luteolibacter pohnpeiensis TaxID=454153 RepID=A0A934S7S7_9BACT|nr:hypothetical protein [Luteolibacter pohnpeiensis]MBK1882376.1 hypothetical protein [Luteolibacter pohnpeiensis]